MNSFWRISKLLAVAAAGVGLIWSAARGDGQRLPDVPAPRATSMLLPMPRLERMSNAPQALASGDSSKVAKPASGEQLMAWLRGTLPMTSLVEAEPPRRGDAEKTADVARRKSEAKVK